MHMIRHNDPRTKFISLAIKERQSPADHIRALGLPQATLSVACIKVPVNAIRIPPKEQLLLVPRKRALRRECLIDDQIALELEASENRARQSARFAERDEIGAALLFDVRQHATRVEARS